MWIAARWFFGIVGPTSIDDRRCRSFTVSGGVEAVERGLQPDRVRADDQARDSAPAQMRDMNTAIGGAHIVGARIGLVPVDYDRCIPRWTADGDVAKVEMNI